MGITGFAEFLKRYAPDAVFNVKLSDLAERCLAYDFNGLVHQMFRVAIKIDVDTSYKRTTEMIYHRLKIYADHNITLKLVFDGKPVKLKQDGSISKKDKQEEPLVTRMEELDNTPQRSPEQEMELQALIVQLVKPGRAYMDYLKKDLLEKGFCVIAAETCGLKVNDAEAVCATLTLNGNNHCYGTITTDSDYHCFGGNVQILDLYKENGIYRAKVRTLERILYQSNMTFDQLRELWVLMGTDYNDNVPLRGPVKCHDAMVTYKSAANMPPHYIPENFYGALELYRSSIVPLKL